MPIVVFVSLYIFVAAAVTFSLPVLIRNMTEPATRHVLILILLVGAAARLVQLGTPALLEDDYNRYLWDGAVVVAGNSPFEYSPLDIADGSAGSADVRALAQRAGQILERVNYPEYRTVYPPVAQAVFAISHVVAPFDLDGWRIMLFLLELGCLIFIYAILVTLGRSPLWLALYWWNPLVIKEIANSAHMEPVVMLPVLAAGLLMIKGHGVWASVFLTVSAGVKVWPLLMVAAVWRQFIEKRHIFILAVSLTVFLLVLIFWPVVASKLDTSSGFVAFAQNWKASSAAFLVSDWLLGFVVPDHENAPMLSQMFLGFLLLAIVVAICIRRAKDTFMAFKRMFLICAALYLLSPSQTPWYFIWIAPFLCFFPVRGLLLAGVTLPLHYLYFHLAPHGQEMLYRYGVVWAIWAPVWALIVFDVARPGAMLGRPRGAV